MRNSSRGWKGFAFGVAIAAIGAVMADVIRDQYRKFKAGS